MYQKTDNISNPKAADKFPERTGFPDGMTINSEGMLWIAHLGNICIGRWNLGNGKMIAKVEVPMINISPTNIYLFTMSYEAL